MDITAICTIIYLIIGVIYIIHDWIKFHQAEYYKAKERGETEDSMVIIYWMFGICFWPIIFILSIFIDKKVK